MVFKDLLELVTTASQPGGQAASQSLIYSVRALTMQSDREPVLHLSSQMSSVQPDTRQTVVTHPVRQVSLTPKWTETHSYPSSQSTIQVVRQ